MVNKVKNPFKKRPAFRAFINIDPANPGKASLQGFEGEIQLHELVIALGALRDDILVKIGQSVPPQANPKK